MLFQKQITNESLEKKAKALQKNLKFNLQQLDEIHKLYELYVQRGMPFPIDLEEHSLQIILKIVRPEDAKVADRLIYVLTQQGKTVPEDIRRLVAHNIATIKETTETEEDKQQPSIFIVTLPKSGSIFVQGAIQKTTGLLPIMPSLGYFPEDILNVDNMMQFSKGGRIAQSHCDASAFNLRVLDFFEINWVLHLRDPRAALLSWIHHIEREDIRYKPSGHLRINPPLPKDLYDLSFEAKVDYQIDQWFPGMVKWISRWCEVMDLPNYQNRIVLTTYEEMHGHDEEFIAGLIKRFHGSVPNNISFPVKDLMTSHFRSGRRDEWKEVFNSQQIKRATDAIGSRLCSRFSWEN